MSRGVLAQGVRTTARAAVVVLLAAAVLALLEGVLAVCGVRPILEDEDPFVGFSGRLPLFVDERDPSGAPTGYVVTAENKLNLFNPQRFAKKKPPNTYRIFCLGGSTTYGHPYVYTTAFGGWIQAMLPETDPSKKWEVINAGGISYASYRVALLMEELVQYEPDLFLVYSGHNEFLERRSYPNLAEASRTRLALATALRGLRTFGVARDLRERLAPTPAPAREDVLAPEVVAILDWANGPWEYERNNPPQDKVLAHYAFNLRRMADIAREAGAQILFATTPVNLRDYGPFKSTHRDDLTEAERNAWNRLVEQAAEAGALGVWDASLAALDEAARIDDRYARLHYQRGKALWALGRFAEAKVAFERAVDEDVCPLRALTPMHEMVRAAARDTGAMLVDFTAWTETHAEHGTPGADLFLDHVHPTLEANRQLALRMLAEMEKAGIVQQAADWGPECIAGVRDAVLATLGPREHSDALRVIARTIRWGGKFEEAERNTRQAIELDPTEAEARYLEGERKMRAGETDAAIARYQQAVALEGDFGRAYVRLGDVMMDRGDYIVALGYYCKALEVQPGLVLAYDCVGRAQHALGRYVDAAQTYDYALRLMPEWPAALVNMGRTLAAMDEFEQAEAHYREALRVDYDFAPAHESLALLQFMQGRWEDAAKHYAHVSRLVPEDASVRAKLELARRQIELRAAR